MILTITLNAAIDKRLVVKCAKEGEVNRVRECVYTPGGKGLNVSKVIHISGADVLAGGLVGGYAGKYIEHELDQMGIGNDFYHIQGESRSCINIWDEEKGKQTEFLEPGFQVTKDEQEEFFNQYLKQIKEAKVISISGSVPKGIDFELYQRLITAAKAEGKKVILDTSGELLVMGLEAKPTLIKPNIDEIRMLTGQACDSMESLIDAAIKLHNQGIEYVIISLGGDGSLMVNEDGVYHAKIPKVNAVNTVGCGDAMVAGLAIGLLKGAPPVELLKSAASIASAAAMSEHTGHYDMENRKKMYHAVKVCKI